ncbi:MAG: DUF434 domain-containing protein [Spirochaetota bacterium]
MPRLSGDHLVPAATDYRWLLDRGYPDQGALRLVGDRYRLSGTERNTLFRGVFSLVDSTRRAARIAEPREGDLTVDGHNVLFTIWNCIAGRPMVLATDGFVRDIGGTRSRLPHDERFDRVARHLCTTLAVLPTGRVTVLLDDPLPWSREHAGVIERIWNEVSDGPSEALVVRTERSVDATVAATREGLIATSDTAIVDRCGVPVADLGGLITTRELNARPIPMAELVG